MVESGQILNAVEHSSHDSVTAPLNLPNVLKGITVIGEFRGPHHDEDVWKAVRQQVHPIFEFRRALAVDSDAVGVLRLVDGTEHEGYLRSVVVNQHPVG